VIDERWSNARRVLAVRLDNLGDVLVTTPALHAIKQSLPGCHLTLLASPVGAQMAALDPDVDDVIVYEAPWMDPWHKLPQDSAREQRMIETLRAGRFDGTIIFTSYHQSPLPPAYLCYLADIPLRVAASIDGPGSLLTTRHKHPDRMMHEVERGLDLVGCLGMGTDERGLVLRVPDAARDEAANALASSVPARPEPISVAKARRGAWHAPSGFTRPRPDAGATTHASDDGAAAMPLVVVHPGCSMPARTYPWEQYVGVVDLLIARLGAHVALTGAADERELVERIYTRLQPESRAQVTRLAGGLSFPGLCALIEQADLAITNNTGPMHIAAAVHTPVVALFALTNPPEQWGPWQVPHRQLYHEVTCRLCYSRVCPYGHECLSLVTPEMVLAACADLLNETCGVPGAKGRRRGSRGAPLESSPLSCGRGAGGEVRAQATGGTR
jgi:ADP-heptose:LPS heptosyltransferase